jgi:chromosome segregation ATPase
VIEDLRTDLAAAQARLAEVTQERDRLRDETGTMDMLLTQAEARLAEMTQDLAEMTRKRDKMSEYYEQAVEKLRIDLTTLAAIRAWADETTQLPGLLRETLLALLDAPPKETT